MLPTPDQKTTPPIQLGHEELRYALEATESNDPLLAMAHTLRAFEVVRAAVRQLAGGLDTDFICRPVKGQEPSLLTMLDIVQAVIEIADSGLSANSHTIVAHLNKAGRPYSKGAQIGTLLGYLESHGLLEKDGHETINGWGIVAKWKVVEPLAQLFRESCLFPKSAEPAAAREARLGSPPSA